MNALRESMRNEVEEVSSRDWDFSAFNFIIIKHYFFFFQQALIFDSNTLLAMSAIIKPVCCISLTSYVDFTQKRMLLTLFHIPVVR